MTIPSRNISNIGQTQIPMRQQISTKPNSKKAGFCVIEDINGAFAINPKCYQVVPDRTA